MQFEAIYNLLCVEGDLCRALSKHMPMERIKHTHNTRDHTCTHTHKAVTAPWIV
eukprot:c14699_g1_i1 orf=29-190(-)